MLTREPDVCCQRAYWEQWQEPPVHCFGAAHAWQMHSFGSTTTPCTAAGAYGAQMACVAGGTRARSESLRSFLQDATKGKEAKLGH